MIDRSVNPTNWNNSSINFKPLNSYSLKNSIETNINSSSVIRSGYTSNDYSFYFGSGLYEVVINSKGVVIVLIHKKSNGSYPDSNFLAKFTEILTTVLKNEISSSGNSYLSYPLNFENNNTFRFGGIKCIIKPYRDTLRTQKIQIDKIKEFLKKIANYSSTNIENIKICGDAYTIDFNNISSIDEIVQTVDAKADCSIKTTSGPIYISLKGVTYRQFGGISGYIEGKAADVISQNEIQEFIDKLKDKRDKLGISQYQRMEGCYSQITNKNLINTALFGRNYNPRGPYGPYNVTYIMIGNIITTENSISASKKNIKNGNILDMTFYIVSSYDASRNDGKVPNTRIGIYDHKYNNPTINF